MSEINRNAKPFSEAGEIGLRDAFLCYCLNVSSDDFKNGVWQQPDLSFTDICARLGVGTKCTACLLNSENLYYTARKERPVDFEEGTPFKSKSIGGNRQRLYAFVDAVAPSVGILSDEVVPIFSASGVTTTMTIANSVSSSIGAQSAKFKGTMEVYDAVGRLSGRRVFSVPQGRRVDILVSEFLSGARDQTGYLVGSCRVKRVPEGPGYRGSIRGHVTVRTPHATSTVHAQEPQKVGIRTFMTTRLNSEEDQFLSLVNCAKQKSSVKVRLVLLFGEGGSRELSTDIPAYGCVLLPLPRLNQGNKDHIHVVEIDTEQRFRSHLVIRSADGLRLSLDHV